MAPDLHGDEVMRAALPLLFSLVTLGCIGDPIGDPCTPEVVPEGGFVAEDTYLEIGSPQCHTRLCIARGLEGDPSPECAGDRCASPDDVRAHAYCTAPCGSDEDCPEGFSCGDVGRQRMICLREP